MKIIITVLFLSMIGRAHSINEVALKISNAAKESGIDPTLAVAIGITESGLKWNAIGTHGEVGPLQVLYFNEVGSVSNLDKNIKEGMKILKTAKDKCSHYPDYSWVNCYNLGINYKRLKYPKLFPYYKKVMENIKRAQRLALK